MTTTASSADAMERLKVEVAKTLETRGVLSRMRVGLLQTFLTCSVSWPSLVSLTIQCFMCQAELRHHVFLAIDEQEPANLKDKPTINNTTGVFRDLTLFQPGAL